jgi:putative cell wall-binding protein
MSRRMKVFTSAVGGLLLVAGLAAPAGAATTGGALDWGVKESFRSYVTGPIAEGTISTSGGATVNDDGTFHFPFRSGSHDSDGAEVRLSGSVRFVGHDGALDLRISGLRVELDGGEGQLVADVVSTSMDDGTTETYDDVALVTLDGDDGSTSGSTTTWEDLDAVLTDDGAPAFAGFYTAGTEFDPVTLTLVAGSSGGGSGGGGGGGGGGSSRTGGSQTSQLAPTSSDGRRTADVSTSAGTVQVALTGASSTGGEVTVKVQPTSSVAASTRAGVSVIGSVFDVAVSGATFQQAEVCLPLAASALPAGTDTSRLQLVHFPSSGSRELLTTSVGSDRVCGRATSLSPFAVGLLGTTRVAGVDAPSTAAAVSAANFEPGATVAYLASRANFADALGAGPAAGTAGPVLLTDRDALPAATATELVRLHPARIVVVGGTGVVSDAVAEAAGAHGPVTRVAGTDRYATAAQLSAGTVSPGVGVAYVVNGASSADGLVSGAAAALTSGPVLLTGRDALPAVTANELRRLRPVRIVVVGGTAAVSEAVASALGAIAPTSRLAGTDRYATAAGVARSFPQGSPVFVAAGTKPADALAGIPAAAKAKAALLLVDGDVVPAAVGAALDTIGPGAITVLGGTAAITTKAELALAGHLPAS